MDQPADRSETPDSPEAEPRHDDESAEPGSTTATAVESAGSMFADPFGDGDAMTGQPPTAAAAGIAEDVALTNAAPTRESLFFDLDTEPDREAPPVSPVNSPVEVVSGYSDASGEPEDDSKLSGAQIVGSALEEIISDLAGSILRTAMSGLETRDWKPETGNWNLPRAVQAAGDVDSTSAELSNSAEDSQRTAPSGDDDHSYQWHAFQEDDDAAPVTLWEDETTAPAVVEVKAPPILPLAASRFQEDPTTRILEVSGSSHSGQVVPTESPTAPEGMLDYESVPAVIIRGGGWTFPVLCAGIGIIACCLLIPICDANRRAAYEKLRLWRDLESLQRQVAVNDQFLHKVADDPTLAERLAQRQLHKIRAGTHFLPLKDDATPGQEDAGFGSMSAFGIVAVPPPPPLAPYQPVSGPIARLCYNPHSRLYLMGAGMMLLAAGLVMGYGPIGAKTNQ
jgi:hypothetical protein